MTLLPGAPGFVGTGARIQSEWLPGFRRNPQRVTIEIDDDEIRRVIAALSQQPAALPQPHVPTATRLLTVKEVAERLGIGRGKAYELVLKGEVRSLTIGRSRRISSEAIAEFIARPRDEVGNAYVAPPRYAPREFVSVPKWPRPPAPRAEPSPSRRRKTTHDIDLAPKPMPTASLAQRMTDKELDDALAGMLAKGWPADVLEQIRADQTDGLHRTNVLTINHTARYLGLSRYGVEKLIAAGKLRLFTIAPMYRDDKPQKRIPAKDVVAIR